jgi:hypothetical protein
MIVSVRFIFLMQLYAMGTDQAVPHLASDPPADDANSALSATGHFQLSWGSGDGQSGARYTLQESATPDFADAQVVYEGPDTASAFSGRRDGVSYFRVRAGDGTWSKPVEVVIQHHSLAKALIYLTIGAVVFLATAALVIAGHVAHRREVAQP